MNVSFTGLDRIQHNLKLKSAETLKATTSGLEKIGQQGTAYVKQNSPVISGRLRGSMGYTIDGKVELAENDPMNAIGDKNTVVIGTNVVYGPSVEYRSQTGSKGFMQRSFNQLRQVAEQMLANHIKREVG